MRISKGSFIGCECGNRMDILLLVLEFQWALLYSSQVVTTHNCTHTRKCPIYTTPSKFLQDPRHITLRSFQFSSVTRSCPTLCDPMNRSTPGLPVRHQLPEFTQTHAHRVGDAIQPSHPLLSPPPPALQSLPASGTFPMSQLFTSGGQSIGVSASASVLPMNTQDWSPLGWTAWISL